MHRTRTDLFLNPFRPVSMADEVPPIGDTFRATLSKSAKSARSAHACQTAAAIQVGRN
jgi:hypothetical protein